MKTTIEVSVDLEDLARDVISGGNRETLLKLIQFIDLRVGEWDFTLALCGYFAEKKKEFDAEEAAELAKASR